MHTRKTFLTFALCIGVAIAACAPAPSPVPPPGPEPDGGPSIYAHACANLKALSCPEGQDPSCAAVLKQGDEKLNMRPACLASAKTTAEAIACKSVRCQR